MTADEVLRVPHLSSLSRAEARRLADECIVRCYPAHALIAVEGQPASGFYQLLAGRARLFRTGTDGREQILQMLRPGDTFAEVSVFDLGVHTCATESLEDCRVLLVPARSLIRILRAHPEVAMKLLTHFARRLHSFTELVEQISLQTVQQRVARYIYTSAREEGEATAEGVLVRRTMTQHELAALVGSVREVVSRTMRLLEEDGLVEIRRTEILVRDMAGLGRLL